MSALAGVYVHIPYCKRKCPYCDFFSTVETNSLPEVLSDIPREAGLTRPAFGSFDSLYIGGGTPSLLTGAQLTTLLEALGRELPLVDGTEITVELNPADVRPDLLHALEAAGVGRLSLGVQSFSDDELRFLGRRHDAAGAMRAIEQIQNAGFADLGLDLIYGLPESSLAHWQASVHRALTFEPAHLSCYALTVARETPLGEWCTSGRVTLPGEDHLADSFLLADRMLVAAGFEHYEVSNFARGPGKRSRHNQKYWRRTPTLGLGPAAHSFDGRTRWRNVADPGEYTSRLACGILPGEDREELTPEQARLETIGLGLRTSDGLERSALDPRPETNSVIASLVSQGLLLQEEGRLRPTERGMLLADALARALC